MAGEEPGFLERVGGLMDRGIEKVGNAIKGVLGMKPKQDPRGIEESRRGEVRPVDPWSSSPVPSSPFGSLLGSASLGLLGALLAPIGRIFAGMLQESRVDTEVVMELARKEVRRSGRYGAQAECGPILGQSYSSMNINGKRTAQVQIQFQVRGDSRAGMAACSASVTESGTELRSLEVDGSYLDVSGASSGRGLVIDV